MKKRHRLKDRVPCNIDCVINDSVICKAVDISEGGMYMLSDHFFTQGSIITVSIHFKDKKIDIRAKIKHCNEGVGMGLMFIGLDDTIKTEIRELLKDVDQSIS
jgi:PilZ domain